MSARPTLKAAVVYQDPRAAIAWLEKAFGFELAMLLEDAEGRIVHCQMAFGDTTLMLGQEWNEDFASPQRLGGKNTQTISILLDEDIDAHCQRASAAGAEILRPPETQFYGDRTYACRDPEGHVWNVSQTVQDVSREEAEAASGLKITGWVH